MVQTQRCKATKHTHIHRKKITSVTVLVHNIQHFGDKASLFATFPRISSTQNIQHFGDKASLFATTMSRKHIFSVSVIVKGLYQLIKVQANSAKQLVQHSLALGPPLHPHGR